MSGQGSPPIAVAGSAHRTVDHYRIGCLSVMSLSAPLVAVATEVHQLTDLSLPRLPRCIWPWIDGRSGVHIRTRTDKVLRASADPINSRGVTPGCWSKGSPRFFVCHHLALKILIRELIGRLYRDSQCLLQGCSGERRSYCLVRDGAIYGGCHCWCKGSPSFF